MPTFTRDQRRLVLTLDSGQQFLDVDPVRAFPITDPLHSVSICDRQGRELLFIESLDDVPAETRRILEEELAEREFVPVILRVLNTPAKTEPASWQVETDRGITTFELENEDAVHRRPPHRVTIIDSRGIRYEIPDTRNLDAHSRRVLDRFL